MNQDDLKQRTKTFALRIIRLIQSLPDNQLAKHIGNQLMRSVTSVAANYRVACRARSTADFIAKMGIVEEEADESAFWMEMLVETDLVSAKLVKDLQDEANQLVAIFVSSINTARRRKR